jgi:hypothetical protein
MGDDKVKALGIAAVFTNPILLVMILVFAGIIFAVGYTILWMYGLVTATILFIGGTVLLYLVGRVSPDALSTYPALFLIPIGLGAFGYTVDHLAMLSMLSVAQIDIITGEFVVDPMILVGFLFVAAFMVVAVAVVTQPKKKRKSKKK